MAFCKVELLDGFEEEGFEELAEFGGLGQAAFEEGHQVLVFVDQLSVLGLFLRVNETPYRHQRRQQRWRIIYRHLLILTEYILNEQLTELITIDILQHLLGPEHRLHRRRVLLDHLTQNIRQVTHEIHIGLLGQSGEDLEEEGLSFREEGQSVDGEEFDDDLGDGTGVGVV